MKLQGSRIATLSCLECTAISGPFRVFLFEDDGDCLWQSKNIPEGWLIEEETEIHDDGTICAYCPAHLRVILKEE